MKIIDLFEHQVSLAPCECHYAKDVKGDNNRGWQVDVVSATIDGNEVGDLRICYIPKHRYEYIVNNSFIKFVNAYEGSSLLPYDQRYVDFPDMDLNTLREVVKTCAWVVLKIDFSSSKNNELLAMTKSQLLEYIDSIEHKLQNKYGHVRKQFEEFHIDNPLVEYIKVDKLFQRKGIATAMYVHAAKCLAEQNLVLHASTMQKPEAKEAWAGMARKGWVSTKQGRQYLDPVKLF